MPCETSFGQEGIESVSLMETERLRISAYTHIYAYAMVDLMMHSLSLVTASIYIVLNLFLSIKNRSGEMIPGGENRGDRIPGWMPSLLCALGAFRGHVV